MRPTRLILAVASTAIALTVTACEKKGPAERAGEKIDHAVATAGQAVDEAGDKVKDAVK